MVAHTFDYSILEAQTDDLRGFEASLVYIGSSKPGLHSEILPQKNN